MISQGTPDSPGELVPLEALRDPGTVGIAASGATDNFREVQIMSKIGLMLAASCLATGLAFAQQGGDYRLSNPAAPDAPPLPSATPPKAAPAPGAAETIAEQAATQIRSKELIGAKAVHEGREVGKVDDLLVEEKNARVVGVVLSVGGVLGVGDKLVAVPWEQIDLIKGKGSKPALYITMSKEQLEAAPYFEPAKSDRQAPKFN